ncbi:TonB-dependent receptor [Nisaea acidiphila]|uniref:TonB-dependent receptor n=1 Tax=Nisaea acidiphila TaxID=1862145 RepID=A0A9J7AUD8_9PROT|nr:TonB-dependent receptor [Nisaea acidiphila]UUX49005.1 TonB-dependent receptor [Nisaea acidiphila]
MQSKLYLRFVYGAALVAIAAPVFAQDTGSPSAQSNAVSSSEAESTAVQATLDPIRVSAPRSAQDDAREKLDLRAGGTSVIGAEEFEDSRATTLSDVLIFAPGVVAQTRHGEETRLSIRGSGIQRGFQLRGIQLYQDGIPLNFADGAGDFQSIDPLALEFVEIWRGANALEYGASTLGGAVNFVTPTGQTSAPVATRLDAGSFGQRRVNLQAGGAQGNLDGFLNLSLGEQDGWRDQSATRATRASANVGHRISDSLEARLYLNYVDSELELPGALTLAQTNDDPEQAASRYSELNASNDYEMGRAALRFTWAPVENAEITTSVFYSERDRHHPTIFGILDQDARNMGVDVRGVFDFAETDAARRLVVGVTGAQYLADEDRYSNSDGQRGTYRGRTELDGRTYTTYAEYSHGLSDTLTIQAGAQFTRADRTLDNLSSPTQSYDKSFYGLSPKLGVLYEISDADQVFANISRSFEPAPFGEARVLPDLPLPDAQEATTFEIGWRRRVSGVNIEAAAYYSTIDNEFLALVDEDGASLGTTNADATVHRGFEFGASFPLSETVALKASYTWNDFRFDDDASFGNNNLAGVPPHILNARLSWAPVSWLTVSPVVEWRGGKTWIDHANTVNDNGHALLHLGVSGNLFEKAEWFVDARNLTDEAYVSSTLVRDNVNGADSASYFPGDPRSVFAGIRFRW